MTCVLKQAEELDLFIYMLRKNHKYKIINLPLSKFSIIFTHETSINVYMYLDARGIFLDEL